MRIKRAQPPCLIFSMPNAVIAPRNSLTGRRWPPTCLAWSSCGRPSGQGVCHEISSPTTPLNIDCCQGGGDPKAKEKGATDSNKTQLFTVPKEQVSHIQVVTIQPMSWPRVLRLNGTVAYNSFLTTPVISQVSGPR